jgi:hypothetical protein
LRKNNDALVKEYFTQGRSFGLKKLETVNGKPREFQFFWEARPDGLVSHLEDEAKVPEPLLHHFLLNFLRLFKLFSGVRTNWKFVKSNFPVQ